MESFSNELDSDTLLLDQLFYTLPYPIGNMPSTFQLICNLFAQVTDKDGSNK